jgi:asparagine synthase (glutamine-hydrolysing)
MSAIAGIINFDGSIVGRYDLERVAKVLRPYGPDRSELMVAGPVGFVNMLMQMTPEDLFDRQPYRSVNGAMITADARIDNRDEVLAQIGVAKELATEWPDSRVLLTAWEMFGDTIWPMLRGPFAVAIWDPRCAALTLSRDHLGVNVVMWYKSERFFAFATMPKGLFAFRGVSRSLNEKKFADFLVLNHSDLATTIYENVYRVIPAHTVTVGIDGSMKQRRYWSVADITPLRLSSDEAYADGLRDRILLAVRRQMRSLHPLGCFLSGGLDSSSIATLVARDLDATGTRLSAFTQVPRHNFDGSVPNGCYADESPFVEAIVKSVPSIDVTYISNHDCDDFVNLERMFEALDGPVRNPMNLGWMLAILRLASSQCRRVVFSGRHGNFSASWTGWSQTADHFRRGRFIKTYRQWLLFYRSTSLSRWQCFRKLLLDPLLPQTFSRWAARHWNPRRAAAWQDDSPIEPAFAEAIGVGARAIQVGHDFRYRWRPDGRDRATTLSDFEGDWGQAIKALTGVEVRDPLADVDVVSYCLAIPPEQFLVEGIDRSLLRRAMWGLVPEVVLTNRLHGIQSADWYEKLTAQRDKLGAEVAQLSSSPLARRFIDFNRLYRALAAWPANDWHNPEVIREYRFVLARGIAGARFLAWLESSAESQSDHRPR